MITPVSPRFLKQEAKKLQKSRNLSRSKALDEVSKKYEFSNYRHYLNVYESNRKKFASTKHVLLKNISLEKDMHKKMELALSFIRNFKIPFRDLLDILKQFQHSERAVQAICEKLNLMKGEIQKFLFNDFLTDEGQYEINFRAPNFIAKEIVINGLTYEIDKDKLCVDGDYVLKTEFEFELDENDPNSKDERFKDREFDGSFGVEIDRNKEIIFVHSDMTTSNGLMPLRAFTEEEMEEYFRNFPDERNQFDDILVLDNPSYDDIKRSLLNNEPLTGKMLEVALDLVEVDGDDEYSKFVRNIGVKLRTGQPLDEYEFHIFVDVLMFHVQLAS
ncbi:hypothetical protein [Legionella tunisiensis]|uniref:hypothetical protein n=1 Tax=Legionella tunisiensis TaxID=1034944 RepID=UPI0002F2D5B2|nr:hypothetical protein [Legionella tunisiensis]